MTDEIKEILEYFRTYATICEYPMLNKIENSITNLYEENQQLKEQLEYYKTKELERINKHLLDAKINYLEGCIKTVKVGDY